MAFMDKLKVLWGKAFVGGEWKVAYRLRNELHGQYCLVDPPAGTWAADPFLYEADGEHYLFVELYEEKKNKACIAYYRFIDGVPVYQGKIIEQPYHMSYPCVFEHKGEHYMVPETSANGTIDLYKAVVFPTKWEHHKPLLSGEKYVDTTVLHWNDAYFAFSHRKAHKGWSLDVFSLDMDSLQMTGLCSKAYETNVCRPAGAFIVGESLVRPAQDCAKKYGENLILYEVESIEEDRYDESKIGCIVAKDILVHVMPDRIHTYNQDGKYECVDLFYEKFDPLHGVKILWRAYLRKHFSKLF